MSYLDIPRIHFGGQFFTDPSTVNNDPEHYDPNTKNPSPWQMPKGQHRFQLKDCLIKSASNQLGYVADDSLLGASIISTDKPSPAKIVDLDVYQQGVSTIYGLQLEIKLSGGGSIKGIVDPVVLNGFWFTAVLPTRSWESDEYGKDSFGGDMNACGWFQSVIRVNKEDWNNGTSNILKELEERTIIEKNQYLISIRFVLDGYENVMQNSNYQYGRIIGSLGPVSLEEPLYNPGQRWMRPREFSQNDAWNSPSFNSCPFKVDSDRKKLILDLSNSICREFAGGPPVDLGDVQAIITSPDATVTSIGLVNYNSFDYDAYAHMSEMSLTSEQLELLENGTLSLLTSRTDIGNNRILGESSDPVVYAVEIRPIRLAGDPGTTEKTRVYISQKGSPLPDKQLAVFVEGVKGNTPGATVPPTNPGNTPQGEGALSASILPSDSHGFAELTLTVEKDPGQRTEELDGQLYFVVVYDPDQTHPDWSVVPPEQDHMVSCLVWSQYGVNENPEWTVIQNMMAPYMKLFPSMKDMLDLTDLHSFSIFSLNPPWEPVYKVNEAGPLGITAGAIPYLMSRDFDDPRFMPLTRDLSPSKILTIMHFIKNLQDSNSNPSEKQIL